MGYKKLWGDWAGGQGHGDGFWRQASRAGLGAVLPVLEHRAWTNSGDLPLQDLQLLSLQQLQVPVVSRVVVVQGHHEVLP